MALKPENVMRAFVAKLYEFATGGETNAIRGSETFISWCQPGFPFSQRDFDYCMKGMVGAIGPERDASGAPTEAAQQKAADETTRLIFQAALASQFVDFVPDPTCVYTRAQQATIYATSQERLSSIYDGILQMAKVVPPDVTDAERTQADNFRKKLWVEVEKENPAYGLPGEPATIKTIQPSPLYSAYLTYQGQWQTAENAYHSKRIAGMTGLREDRLDFALNGDQYRTNVQSALDAWASAGYKNQVERMNQYIADVEGRDLRLWLRKLKDRFGEAVIKDATSGNSFHPAFFYPQNFAISQGWLDYSFDEGSCITYSSRDMSTWSGSGAGLIFLPWAFGVASGGGSGRTDTFDSWSHFRKFSMSFSFTQVNILRPWFSPELFNCRGWTIEKGTWHFGNGKFPLSNGQNPPDGSFIAYPYAALFVKDVEINFFENEGEIYTLKEFLEGSSSSGWGILCFGGRSSSSWSSEHETSTSRIEWTASGIKVKGLQLVGFKNRLVGKCPNPDPDIPPEKFE
ncbi:MAG: hypothetical protein U0350_06695 [Caldilineaceae bacterium]